MELWICITHLFGLENKKCINSIGLKGFTLSLLLICDIILMGLA
jgi:hypothetical protein